MFFFNMFFFKTTRLFFRALFQGGGLTLALLLLGGGGVFAVSYDIQDLGALPGSLDSYSFAFGLNDQADVVGKSYSAQDQATHPCLYRRGRVEDLGTYGGLYNAVLAINDSGEIVGYSDFLDEYAAQAVLDFQGEMLDLGTLGGNSSYAYGINNREEIVGYSDTAGSGPTHAFLYFHGRMTDLGTLIGENGASEAYAVNQSGDIVGTSSAPSALYHAFLYTDGAMRDLGSLGGDASEATALNNRGEVVGDSTPSPDSYHVHAFLYGNGGMLDLGTLGGQDSNAWGINDAGEVVGSSSTPDVGSNAGPNHAFVSEHRRLVDLNSRIPAVAGWSLISAQAINVRGQIAGYGLNRSGVIHAFLLTPIALRSLALTPASTKGGAEVIGRVTLAFPAAHSVRVTLTVSNPRLVRLSADHVTVTPGKQTATFRVQSSLRPLSRPITAVIRAGVPGSAQQAFLTITP